MDFAFVGGLSFGGAFLMGGRKVPRDQLDPLSPFQVDSIARLVPSRAKSTVRRRRKNRRG